MLKVRVIPCLLLRDESLVKTVRFKDPDYIGDPANTVRIFNELEVDELAMLDISATRQARGPDERRLRPRGHPTPGEIPRGGQGQRARGNRFKPVP